MNILSRTLLLACAFAAMPPLLAADPASLDAHLEPLRPLLGKTWRGEFKNSTPEKPMIDIARWERALNGKAIRLLHSLNQGAYGGETIVIWDTKKQAVVYYYFTTAGFMTTGTMSFEGDKVMTHEVVNGSGEGITEVRGTSEVRADGTFHVKTEYLKQGEWVPGREVTYKQDASAAVEFK